MLGYRLEQARLAMGQAACEIGSVVCTGRANESSHPLRVVRQRCLQDGRVELVVASEIVLRLED